ncbi:AAA family ATPase, partial [archaeon]|nr:AAA family ATPase [archaeon]
MVKIIGIVSAKGGVGKTVTTCNLGIAFASKFNKKVIIMDCNLTTSHISLYLGMNLNHYSITLNNVLRNEARLEQAVYYYPFGLGIVPTSTELKDLINVEISDLKTMIKETFIGHDIVLLDAAPCLGREALITLQTSDEILFVANPTIPSVVDITKCLEVLKELKANPVGIVLNRVKNHKYELNEREIERLTGLQVIG